MNDGRATLAPRLRVSYVVNIATICMVANHVIDASKTAHKIPSANAGPPALTVASAIIEDRQQACPQA